MTSEDGDSRKADAQPQPTEGDPITILRGAYAGAGPTADEARTTDRAAEAAIEDRRYALG